MINLSSHISTYLGKVPAKIKLSEYPLTKIDLAKIDGIQQDIPLFKGVKIEDIAFITKRWETLNFFRGCKWRCTHCLKNAIAPIKGRESILFEDLVRVVDGFKELNERLGFDSLNGNRYISIIDDSNPIDLPIKGLSRSHSVAEGMKQIYDKLNIPTLFVTSGIDSKSQYSTKASTEIVDMVKNNPHSVLNVQISINPFMVIPHTTSLSQGAREQKYIDRMAKTLFAFLDLFKIDKASIIYRHTDGTEKNHKGVDEASAKKMYEAIYKQLQELSGSNLENLPQLRPEKVTKFDKSHLIEPSGRGRNFFSFQRNMKLQNELLQDYLDWNATSKEEQREILLNYSLKCVDIDGSIYTTRPSNAESVSTPIELIIPTDIKLNYINKEKPNKIFSDIEC